MGCQAVKPVVDGIEREYKRELRVIRVNIQDTKGRQLAEVYDFEYTPTFIFFDQQGQEVWRSVGELDPDRVRESLE